MTRQEQLEKLKIRVKSKFNYLKDCDIETMVEMAIGDYIAIRFPSENGRPEVENLNIDAFVGIWLYKRIIDIVERAGASNVTSYKENGLSYQYGNTYIDSNLMSEIMPKASVPR